MTSNPLRDLERLAARQQALFSRKQAYALGVPKRTVDRRVAEGVWREVGPSVLAMAGAPRRDDSHLWAAVLGLRGAVVSHGSASRVQVLRYAEHLPEMVSVPLRTTHTFPGVRVREVTDLRDVDVMDIGGLPVTTPVRTVVDLAALLRPPRLRRVVEDALAAQRFDVVTLRETIEVLGRRGKRGFVALRQIADDVGAGVHVPASELEARLRDLIAQSGLPQPQSQGRPPWWDGRFGMVDFLYEAARLIVEVDGRRWHTRDATYDDDRRRDHLATLAGWRVLRFTWRDVVERPEYVVATIRAALALAV